MQGKAPFSSGWFLTNATIMPSGFFWLNGNHILSSCLFYTIMACLRLVVDVFEVVVGGCRYF